MATQEQLTAAETSYHNLVTGIMPRVVVDQNGERVEFTPTTAPKLLAYIQSLRSQLTGAVANRPMRPYF